MLSDAEKADAERFDRYLRERMAAGKTETEVCALWPSASGLWRRWKQTKEERTACAIASVMGLRRHHV
jgi:hypothetical protein